MNDAEKIRALIRSLCSLFYVGTPNHKRVIEICMESAADLSMDVYGYNFGEGLWQPGRVKPKDGDMDPIEVLNRILRSGRDPFCGKRKLFLLEHFDLLIENRDPLILTKLRAINDAANTPYTVILMGRPWFRLPDIITDIPQVSITALTPHDIEERVESCQRGLPETDKRELVAALGGLTSLQVENVLALCLARKKGLDLQFLRRERARLILQKAGRLIQLVDPVIDLDHVGGLDILKGWLMKRGSKSHAKGAMNPGKMRSPKGVLLTGPPGCGKSYLARGLAGSWGVNLVKLDPPRLFTSLVGETEQNVLAAFETVKSMAPAILWIDEFEKLFPSLTDSRSDGGVLSRVLALFLDFLQEKRDGIFVCATTNAIAGLPQEIMRAGRFDAVFFIDLPNSRERETILGMMFEKHGLADRLRVTGEMVGATEGFSGAEIEQAVVELLYEEDGSDRPFNEFTFLRIIRDMVPLARTMEENISLMRKWYSTRARFASSSEDTDRKGRSKVCHMSQR